MTAASRAAAILATLALVAACAGGPTSVEDGTAEATDGRVVVHRTAVPALHPSVDGYAEATLLIDASDGTRHRLAVKVAATSSERAHGLMEVPDVPAGTGMWFVYDDDRTGGFWMKDTLVPLDIAFVAADGTIVDILEMVPCDADPCPSYVPSGAYRSALEVPAGWFAANGVTVGDRVAAA